MKVLLITVGSRGDAEPFCALAETLANAGHDVDLWMQSEHRKLLSSSSSSLDGHNISYYELPFSTMDFYKFVQRPNADHDHPNPRVRFTGIICEVVGHLVLPCTTQVLQESCCHRPTLSNGSKEQEEQQQLSPSSPSVIVASSLARHMGMALATKLDVPLCLVQLSPMLPTKDFAHYSHTKDCIQAITTGEKPDNDDDTIDTYWVLEEFQYRFIREKWEAVYTELGIDDKFPTFADVKHVLEGNRDSIVLANNFSDRVIPVCSDHGGDNTWNVGALADDYLPSDWRPPQELVDFLGAGDVKPVCVGYGSMPFEKIQIIVEAIHRTNERAVLVGSAMTNAMVDGSDHILTIESVPYSFLLPQCCMMLSHGGAGVIHATLRAGIPSVVSPLMGDQFFWANLLEEKGLGVVAGSLPDLSVDTLVESIERARECSPACETLGTAICEQESGAKRMLQMLEERFG